MKKTLRYPELWQKKRTELPVKGNPDTEWLQMSAMLDKQMPVSGVIKKPFRFKLPKWGLHVFVGISTVAAVYVVSQLYFSKKHNHSVKLSIQQIHRDSLVPAVKDTLTVRDPVKPAVIVSAQGNTNITNTNPLLNNQTKRNIDTIQNDRHQIIDSIMAQPALNIPIHRDSTIVPVKVVPLKAVRDSAGAVDIKKNGVTKDTSKNKKPLNKKKRRFSVFT